MDRKPSMNHAKFGTLLGLAPGKVPVYSSDYDTIDEGRFSTRESLRSYVDGIYMGYKWQCVEFARRWCYLTHGYVFDDIPMAYDIFKLSYVNDVKHQTRLPLKSFKNGCPRPPTIGSLLIWDDSGFFEVTGHVAVIINVQENFVDIVEQNVEQQIWPEGQHYSRRLRAKRDRFGGFWIACDQMGSDITGWVTQTDDNAHAEPVPVNDSGLFNIKAKRLDFSQMNQRGWLNIANLDEDYYVRVNDYKLAQDERDNNLFFCISHTAHQNLIRATNELHAMFMHTTHLVLKHDELFDKFCIPKKLWQKVQNSWKHRRNENITGRFDFCVSERGIKLYEYNIDTSACYLETAKIQGKWAKHHGCTLGVDSGDKLSYRLEKCWAHSAVNGLLHILTDHNDQEEIYHSYYMKQIIEDAGIKTKIITDIAQLHLNEKGQIVDDEGYKVEWIWKTWAWETAIQQMREALENGDHSKPNLATVLLNNHTLIYEPLWAVVTSNKALLPILWELYPSNRYLLNSQFKLNDPLLNAGYVTKPIAGRCGSNIELYGAYQDKQHYTAGHFSYQELIYQELWSLPKVDDQYVQISTFTVDGSYAGACARADSSKIITKDSQLIPLRIVDDHLF